MYQSILCRNDFLNIGRELELAKERDMAEYFSIVDKLRDMYRQSEAVCFPYFNITK